MIVIWGVFLHHETERSVRVEAMSALLTVTYEAPEPSTVPGVQSAFNKCLIHFEYIWIN